MPSVSSCISRSAAKPIISRRDMVSELFQKRAKGEFVFGHRGDPWVRSFLDNSLLPRIITGATNWPAYARLWTVATAGQLVASYTTSRGTTVAGVPPFFSRRLNHVLPAPGTDM
jgi:hypothetical protein